MAQGTPSLEGFRAAFRQPSVALAEISWRWTFGAAGSALLLLTAFEYLDTLPVTAGDALFLKSRHPFLVAQAFAHIVAGSGERLMTASIVLAIALGTLWILISSLGRAATIRPLLDYFRSGQSSALGDGASFATLYRRSRDFRSLAALNFLRLSLALAGLLAIVSSGVLASFASTPANPQPGLAFLIFLPLAALVALFWSSMNWFLSIASIFVLRDESDVFGSVASAVDFCLRRSGAISWSSTVFGLCHLVVFVIASSVVVFPLAFIGILPQSIVFGAVLVLTLLYFAVVDFFYVGRLAAYVCILERPDGPASVSIPTPGLVPPQMNAVLPTVSTSTCESLSTPVTDRWSSIPASEDDILSDVPLPPSDPGKNQN